MEPQFSLLEEDWIPVVREGERVSISLREALLNAGGYGRIDAGHPLKTVALYRLLLALLHRALAGPQSVAQAAGWWTTGEFPPGPLEAYLERHAGRFFLFGPEPFMQVAGLDPQRVGENFRSHWTRLSTDQGSSNTTAVFNVQARPGGPRRDALSPAEAAQELLTHQAFALGGLIKRFTVSARGAPLAGFALFLAEGENLFQTLCLNLPPYRPSPDDAPPWELPPLDFAAVKAMYDRSQTHLPGGRVSRYTWLSRSVLLLPEEGPQGTRVRDIGYAAGIPLDGDETAPTYGSGTDLDPMAALRGGRQAYPFGLRRDQLIWRDLTSLLPGPAREMVKNKKGEEILPGQAPHVLGHAGALLQTLDDLTSGDLTPGVASGLAVGDDFDDSDAAYRVRAPDVIPLSVFGQLTFQGKAFAMRQESYSLPRQVLERPQLYADHVQGALQQAGDLGATLRYATELLARALLQGDGEREPASGAVRTLASGFPTLPTYWAELELPFRHYLLELADDPEPARARWHAELVRAARAAWRLAEEAAGLNAVGLRAVQVSKGPLLAGLRRLGPPPTSSPQGAQ